MSRAALIGGVICLWTIGLLAQSSPPVSSRATQPTPTFEKDILPIVENHCQQCHRPGQIGPFSFLDYRSALGRDRSQFPQCRRAKLRESARLIVVEAAGVEPASESTSSKDSTCVAASEISCPA